MPSGEALSSLADKPVLSGVEWAAIGAQRYAPPIHA